jgi:hypothetical protein
MDRVEMTTRAQILAGVAILFGPPGLGLGSFPPPPLPFVGTSVYFEQNATDGDYEIVFEATGGAAGLAKLTVVAPDGRTVIDFTAPAASTLGFRQFRFESPEPSDFASLQSAYPAGVYTFSGATGTGAQLQGTSRLSHTLPAPVTGVRPAADARDVGTRDLGITWTPVQNLAAYALYIEQAELGVEITARLPGSAAAFAVPNGFLVPGRAYQLGIGAVTKDGNISFVETTFTTAGKE